MDIRVDLKLFFHDYSIDESSDGSREMSEETDISIEPDTDIESNQEESSLVFWIASFIKIKRIDREESHSETTSSDGRNWR